MCQVLCIWKLCHWSVKGNGLLAQTPGGSEFSKPVHFALCPRAHHVFLEPHFRFLHLPHSSHTQVAEGQHRERAELIPGQSTGPHLPVSPPRETRGKSEAIFLVSVKTRPGLSQQPCVCRTESCPHLVNLLLSKGPPNLEACSSPSVHFQEDSNPFKIKCMSPRLSLDLK